MDEGLVFAGATTGFWHHAFKIPWVSVGNLVFKIGFNFALPIPWISVFGE